MASESDIEVAAERYESSLRRFFSEEMEPSGLVQHYNDQQKLARAYLSRLATDRAEREERARPIDAEWLGSVVSGSYMPEYKMFIANFGDPLREVAIVDTDNGWNAFGWRCVNRGQFLDLLRVLKGGDE